MIIASGVARKSYLWRRYAVMTQQWREYCDRTRDSLDSLIYDPRN